VRSAGFLHLIHPGYLVGVLVVLIVAQLLYVFWPYRRRRFLVVLLSTAIGVLLGQIWVLWGLPGVQLGDANLLPGILFAVAMQPLGDRLLESLHR
jgi:hypothetical protein